MTNVLLLKAPSNDSPDRYEECFKRQGYTPHSIPVLETILDNLDSLQRIVSTGPGVHGYDGVIITSKRAGDAWRHAVAALESVRVATPPVSWSSTPFYVVGEATAAVLSSIRKDYQDSHFAPNLIRGGSEAGTAQRLASFILEDLDTTSPRKLLYLTGDKNLKTLPDILNDAGNIGLESLQVYQTRGSSRVASAVDEAVQSTEEDSKPWWIVYFAPSSASIVTPVLRGHFDLPKMDSPGTERVNIAGIGQTTSVFLRDELQLHVSTTPDKPTPEELVTAISAYDRRKNDG